MIGQETRRRGHGRSEEPISSRPHSCIQHARTDNIHSHHRSVALRHVHTSVSGCQVLTHRLQERRSSDMLAATADDRMQESEISKHARVSASEVRFVSTVARLSKESGCAIAREAWEGMEHLIHRRRRGAAQGFSSLALTYDPSPERAFARIEVPFETLQRRHRRRCRNPGPDGRHGRTAS